MSNRLPQHLVHTIGTLGHFSENILDEMVTILDHLHKYVPMVTEERMVVHPVTGDGITVPSHCFHCLFLGGYQLTAARVRGAQRICDNSDIERGKLLGLVPLCRTGTQSFA